MAELDFARIKGNVAKMVEQGAPESDIDAYIAAEGTSVDAIKSFKAPVQEKSLVAGAVDAGGDFARGAFQGATMNYGDRVQAAIATPFIKAGRALVGQGGKGWGDTYKEALQIASGDLAKREERSPVLTGVGEIAGGVGAGIGAAGAAGKVIPNAVSAAARAFPGTAAAVTGAVSGGLYATGDTQGGIDEKMEAAGSGAAWGAAGGVVGAKVLGPLAQKALKYRDARRAAQIAADSPFQTPAINTPQTSLAPGQTVRMTQGQMTQDPSKQALEIAARKGGLGDESQNLMMQADRQQQQEIRNVLSGIAQPDEGALAAAGNQIRQAYKSSAAQVSKAYDDKRAVQNVFLAKQPIAELFVPQVKAILKDGGFDVTDMSERSRKLIGQLDSPALKDPKVTAMKLESMEFWRKKVSNAIADNTDQFGKLNSEGVALKRTLEAYDQFMAKLPDDALKSGDAGAIEAIQKATSMRRRQGILFERDKAVERMVKTQELTDEELANMVLTGSSKSEKIHSGSGRLVKNLKRAAGDKAPELQAGLKAGTIARLLKNGTSKTMEGETERMMLQPAKLRNELDAMLSNKSFVREVFSPDEVKTLTALQNDLRKIASEQAGANNYSNTAYTLMRALQSLPLGLSSTSALTTPALKAVGDNMARKSLERDLSPVLSDIAQRLSSTRRFYGAVGGGVAAQEEIRPFLTDAKGNQYNLPPKE